jgi:hypothetical protein
MKGAPTSIFLSIALSSVKGANSRPNLPFSNGEYAVMEGHDKFESVVHPLPHT